MITEVPYVDLIILSMNLSLNKSVLDELNHYSTRIQSTLCWSVKLMVFK